MYYVSDITDDYILLTKNEYLIKFKKKYYINFITNDQLIKYNKCNIILNYTKDEIIIGIINLKIKNTIIYHHYYKINENIIDNENDNENDI
jgi:hypothetical protein